LQLLSAFFPNGRILGEQGGLTISYNHRAYRPLLKSLRVSTARLEKGLIRDLRAADSAMNQPVAMATVQAWLKEDAGGSCSDRRAVELLQETWYQFIMETYGILWIYVELGVAMEAHLCCFMFFHYFSQYSTIILGVQHL